MIKKLPDGFLNIEGTATYCNEQGKFLLKCKGGFIRLKFTKDTNGRRVNVRFNETYNAAAKMLATLFLGLKKGYTLAYRDGNPENITAANILVLPNKKTKISIAAKEAKEAKLSEPKPVKEKKQRSVAPRIMKPTTLRPGPTGRVFELDEVIAAARLKSEQGEAVAARSLGLTPWLMTQLFKKTLTKDVMIEIFGAKPKRAVIPKQKLEFDPNCEEQIFDPYANYINLDKHKPTDDQSQRFHAGVQRYAS